MNFTQFLDVWIQTETISTEDVLASFLPLVREVIEAHRAGCVAPLEGLDALQVEHSKIWFEQGKQLPVRRSESALQKIATANIAGLEIVEETRRTSDTNDGIDQVTRGEIGVRGELLTRPLYLPGYVTWEHEVGHHDPLTDIFSLGLILASLTCGLNFSDPADLETFVTNRRNLFALRPNLHPALAGVILRMTELDRHRRDQDLPALLYSLENYRDQQVAFDLDLARVAGFQSRDRRSKQHVILSKLRDRLFDLSKRNTLLHFRATMQNVNLTHASIPLLLNIRNIREDQILVANQRFLKQIVAGKTISLNKYLNFAEAVYLPSLLDRIIADVRRDQNEYGFAQLRLVLCSLSWANLKEKPIEPFVSPLVLLPVRLTKTKGIRDTYQLEPLGTEAEINPVVRHQFRRLYNIDLPETIDLATATLESLHEHLAAQVKASEPAVTVNRVDRPRIDLIHEKAKRRLDQYRRTARLAGRGVRNFMNQDYSYDAANFHPMGIKLFSSLVRTPSSNLRTVLEDRPRPRSYMTGPNPEDLEPKADVSPKAPPLSIEKERTFYQVRKTADQNPYLWNFDLCSVTLANFHYRRMSLVRDYEAIADRELSSAAFDNTFSLSPRPLGRDLPPVPALEDRYDVVPCDPTQAMAIAEAREGNSYIIQGPPGTGKSQTITNLIADFVARGQRVLFVCEKRAAIDVVYARLKQTGLGSLGCLIHDSQSDKKEFILDLKQTYEALTTDEDVDDTSRNRQARQSLLKKMERNLTPLERFDEVMQVEHESLGLPMRAFLDRCVELERVRPEIEPEAAEGLPAYAEWYQHRDQLAGLSPTIEELEPSGVWAKHPLRLLSPALVAAERPIETVKRLTDEAQISLKLMNEKLSSCGIPAEQWPTLARVQELLSYFSEVAPLARHGNLALADPKSTRAKQFGQHLDRVKKLEAALQTAQQATAHWRQKIPPGDLPNAIEQAENFAKQSFPYFSLAWWRLRGVMNRSYQFSAHAVRPSWVQVLTALQHEYTTEAQLQQASQDATQEFHPTGSLSELLLQARDLRKRAASLPPPLAKIHHDLLQSEKADSLVDRVLAAAAPAEQLQRALSQFVISFENLGLKQLGDELQGISRSAGQVPRALYWLGQLGQLPDGIGETLRSRLWTIAAAEAAIARHTWETICRGDRELNQYNGSIVKRCVDRLENQYDDWLASNAQEVMCRVKQRFLENARLCNQPNAQLSPELRDLKKAYSQGRRTLEHEFGKIMRYKAIRELVEGNSGLVIRDLKPVWLMSPLSVSDTLPLATDFFDVVIFDEASQVTLEEAVPAIFRGTQVIVVGDEMQLPPTDFFSTKSNDEDDGELLFEESGEQVRYDLQSDSFLSHAAKNLASTMLGWHYRSRSESLISFSNWAFYDGRLLTVPDCRLSHLAASDATLQTNSGRPTAETAADLFKSADALLATPLSFHHLPHGVYEDRRNRTEADYIASIVRNLLARPEKRSIAIIAFSEAQQDEIEGALHRLTLEDDEFRQRYEEESQREEDGQFVGLLVKNLENIQGDERDVVILSICYGPGPTGKMLMNFGPINKSGGEKRLNVAFSRAKQFMAVVSSIQHTQITNDYNAGANCLKNYLRYAEASSRGDVVGARRVTAGLSRWNDTAVAAKTEPGDAVGRQVRDELIARGFEVDCAVGQSHFRVDLAVRQPGDSGYRLGILIDSVESYEQSGSLERELLRPRLLRAFGWQIVSVLGKDWMEDRESVLQKVASVLAPK